MKKLLTALFIATGLAASAQALIIGADAGYLLDSEEEYLSARLGFEFKAQEALSHQIELEIGYSQADEAGLSADILPVTLNYRLQAAGTGGFGYYAGLGAGFARTSIDGASIFGPVRLRDTSFAAQAFAGVTYQVGPSTTLSLGAKYIWIDDANFAGSTVEVGDDVALQAGFSFKF
ncbi:MAG TPA: outer membrane beta-barrel protein [Lacunisphaera sp.]